MLLTEHWLEDENYKASIATAGSIKQCSGQCQLSSEVNCGSKTLTGCLSWKLWQQQQQTELCPLEDWQHPVHMGGKKLTAKVES